MDLVSDFANVVKDKIMEQVPVFEKNLLRAAYSTLEDHQNASGVLAGLKSLYDSMDDVVNAFKQNNPVCDNSVHEFLPFIKKEIENKCAELKYFTIQNLGVQQGLRGIGDSLEQAAETFIKSLDQKPVVGVATEDTAIPSDSEA